MDRKAIFGNKNAVRKLRFGVKGVEKQGSFDPSPRLASNETL